MLSKITVDFLGELSKTSEELYQEGGLLYKYHFGHRCAHTDLNDIPGKKCENKTSIVSEIEKFIYCAITDPNPVEVGSKEKELAKTLFDLMQKDFMGFKGPNMSLIEDGYSKALYFVFTDNNDYHYLELFWSID